MAREAHPAATADRRCAAIVHLASHNRTEHTLDRNALLRSFFDQGGVGLEIGPSYNPLMPKASGARVETVDHATASELREKYREAGVDISNIEEVDYVLKGQTLLEGVGKPGHYDWIVASHVIEHVPDLVGFLKDCEVLLKPTGVLVLAVPDKRLCFDALQRCTSTGEALQVHLDGRLRPNPGAIFDAIAYDARRGSSHAWAKTDYSALRLTGDLAAAKAAFDAAQRTSDYIDAHLWRFTPSLFRLIISDLAAIGAIRLRERAFAEGVITEFYAALSVDAPGCPISRQALALLAVAEQQQVPLLEQRVA
jgi:SAM-dependent methyltransferase